jgi:hypothetical protein
VSPAEQAQIESRPTQNLEAYELYLRGNDYDRQSEELSTDAVLGPELAQGFDAVRAHHEGFGFVAGGTEPDQELWVEDVRSPVFGNAAVIGAIWLFGDRAAPTRIHGPPSATCGCDFGS